ncbi:hypothetical protein GQ53DRAFT_452818 [Thozetella sp. PMI_491]|nr:hypothetical protein GQ53DRAFT_452818 [Thozetella sp. PMI_491]
MPTRGILMRLASQKDEEVPSQSALLPPTVAPHIEATYTFRCDDNGSPEYNTIYFLSDIEPILERDTFYTEDQKGHEQDFSALSWVIASFINGRGNGDAVASSETHVPASPPTVGSVLVANGSTPVPEKEYDYHAWYDEEHGAKLAHVPGWQLSRRYKLEKSYGDVPTANFYGLNFYDEQNGLGGPEWKAGVTDWTLRIRQQAAKPNIRRVWKLSLVQAA